MVMANYWNREARLSYRTYQHQQATIAKQAARIKELEKAMSALVGGLNKTNWSSWQTKAHFSDELKRAEEALKEQSK
jgi:hypothetical protein